MTVPDLLPYLVRRGLLTPAASEAGGVLLEDASRRNQNARVVNRDGQSYFVKRGLEEDAANIAREAALYQALQAAPEAAAAVDYLPRCFDFDPASSQLVLELVPGAEDLHTYHERLGRFPVEVAVHIADALSILHQLPASLLAAPGLLRGPPLSLSMHRPQLERFGELSPANVALIKALQRDARVCQLLDRLRQEWRAVALIHADLRWDNVLVCAGPPPHLKLIDWELAGLGDPCWDIACVFAEYLRAWVLSMPPASGLPAERLPEAAGHPLEEMMPAMGAFWSRYCNRLGFDSTAAQGMLLNVMAYLSPRLIEFAHTQAYTSPLLGGHAGLLLTLAQNVAHRPQDAALNLLGLPMRESIEA